MIAVYRMIGAPHFGGSCRFSPSCSEYAMKAVRSLPPGRAIQLTIQRLLKCRPFGPFGYDPVPKVGES